MRITNSVRDRLLAFWDNDRSLSVLLVMLLIFLLVLHPLVYYDMTNVWGANIILSLLTVAGVATLLNRKSRLLVYCVGLIAACYLFLQWFQPPSRGVGLDVIRYAIGVLFFSTLGTAVLIRSLAPGPVNTYHIQGSVVVYLLIAVVFSQAYSLLFLLDASSFNFSSVLKIPSASHPNFVYFSFATLTTTGYGDITPVLPVAQSLAMLEALTGQLFPAVLIARLVSQSLMPEKSPEA